MNLIANPVFGHAAHNTSLKVGCNEHHPLIIK